MTDTAVSLAFLLGKLSNAEESVRLLLGDAFTFIPEEDVAGGRTGTESDSGRENLPIAGTKTIDEVDEAELPHIALDFEESDYDEDLAMKVLAKVADEEDSCTYTEQMRCKQNDDSSTIPSTGPNHTDEGEKSDSRDVDTDEKLGDVATGPTGGAGTEEEVSNGYPFPFNINDAIGAPSLKRLSSSPFASIGFMSPERGDEVKGNPTEEGGDQGVGAPRKPTLKFIGSIFLPNEFSVDQQHLTQSRDHQAGDLLYQAQVQKGPLLPKEVFTSDAAYLEAGDLASHHLGSFTGKSASGTPTATALLHNGALSPGWSTGRNASATSGQTPPASSRVMSFQKAQCFKTRQCRFWLDGRCTRGDECTFAHCGNELREKPNLVKTKICSKWKLGHCSKQQHQCSYAHGIEDLRVLPSAVGGPLTPKAQVAYNDFGF